MKKYANEKYKNENDTEQSLEQRLTLLLNSKIDQIKESFSPVGNVFSHKLTDLEKVPPPDLAPATSFDKYSFHLWLKKVPNLLKHIGIKYSNFANITSYLKAFAKTIAVTASHLNQGEYNSLLCSTLDYKTKEQLFCYMSNQQIWGISSAKFHDILISSLGKQQSYNSRKASFHSYNPNNDATASNLASFVAKVVQLGESANAAPLDVYFKICSNLPGHAQSELRAAVRQYRTYDPDYLPTPADILEILSESANSIAYHFARNRKTAQIGSIDNNRTVNEKDFVENEKEYEINVTETNQGNRDPPKQFTQMKEYKPSSFKGYSTEEPKEKRYQGGQNKLFNPNERTREERAKYQGRVPTCANCLMRGHDYRACNFKKFACTMCGSDKHIGPECNVYKGLTPVARACQNCMKYGERYHHDTSHCKFNKDTKRHEISPAKNGN